MATQLRRHSCHSAGRFHQLSTHHSTQFELSYIPIHTRFTSHFPPHLSAQPWATGVRKLTRRLATLSKGNQHLVVQHKIGRPQVSFWWTTLWNVMSHFDALTLLVWRQKGHPTCKKSWVLVYWRSGLDWPLCHCAVAQAPPLRRTQAGPFEIFWRVRYWEKLRLRNFINYW